MTRNANAAMLDEVDAYYAERSVQPANTEQREVETLYDIASRATNWIPEVVAVRMIEAADVLRRTGGSVGPKAYGSNWPQYYHDKADKNDVQAYIQMQADVVAKIDREGARPDIYQISRAEKALRWPAEYLTHAIDADAVTLWALCKAFNVTARSIIAERKSVALRKAWKAEEQENARRLALRKAAALRVATWANERLQTAAPDRAEKIKHNAVIKLARECKDIMPVRVKPHEVEPDIVIGERMLGRHKHTAWRLICAGLIRNQVPFEPVSTRRALSIAASRVLNVAQ